MKTMKICKSLRVNKGCFSFDVSMISDFFSGDFYYKTVTDEFYKPLFFKKLKINKYKNETMFYFVGSNDFVLIRDSFSKFYLNGTSLTVTDKEKIKIIKELLYKIKSETEKNTIYSIIQSYREKYTDLTGVFRGSPSSLIRELWENGFSEKEIEKIQKKYF